MAAVITCQQRALPAASCLLLFGATLTKSDHAVWSRLRHLCLGFGEHAGLAAKLASDIDKGIDSNTVQVRSCLARTEQYLAIDLFSIVFHAVASNTEI